MAPLPTADSAEPTDRPWQQLSSWIDVGQTEDIEALLHSLSPTDAVRAVLKLPANARDTLLEMLDPAQAAGILDDMPDEQLADLVETLTPAAAAAIVEELHTDEQADVIGNLEPETVEAILAEMEPVAAADVRRLAAYDADTAGGLMVPEVFVLPRSATVRDVLTRISEEEDLEHYRGQHPYVVDDDGVLLGVVSLRNLLLSRKSAALTDLMREPVAMSAEADIDALDAYFHEHESFLGAPVVDAGRRLLGYVSRDALAEAVLERADATRRRIQGVVGDELRSMPTGIRARRRLSWLSINIVLNVLAASVIAAYEDTLAAVIALAVFLPIVSDMSGCSGNQAVAVTMRELALGVVKPVDLLSVWGKEVSVGLINGTALGLLIATVAWLWKGNPFLGLVVGGALAVNTVVAVSIGGTVPLALRRFGVDPAVASGPILTTVTDMCGFALVLTFATLALPLIS